MRTTICASITALVLASATSAQVSSPRAAPDPTISAAPSPAPTDSTFALHVICRGTGEHRVRNFGSAVAFSGDQSIQAYGTSTQNNQFGEQMDIDITGSVAKVRVPRRFLPPAHGGHDGWFAVSNLVIGSDEITGKVEINFIQHPNLRIDRRSGSVALDGKVGSFSGQCEKYDPGQHAF